MTKMNNENDMNEATAELVKAAKSLDGFGERIGGIEGRLQKMESAIEQQDEEGERMFDEVKSLRMETKGVMQNGKPARLSEKMARGFGEFIASDNRDILTKEVSEQTGPEGRFALPLEISTTVQDMLFEINPMRRLANVVSTSSPDYRHLLTAKGASSGWGGEIDERTLTDTPELAAIEPVMAENYALAQITQWAADDLLKGSGGVENWLFDSIATEFGRTEGDKFINGTGVKEPLGLLTVPSTTDDDVTRPLGTFRHVATGNATGLGSDGGFDALIDAVYSLQGSFRTNSSWLMNSATAGAIQKVKDADGRLLWSESMVMGQPASLLGYPVQIAEEMPDIAADAAPIAFGDFQRGYLIADLNRQRVIRDEVTRPGWIKFYQFRRLTGIPTDTRAIRLIRVEA